MAGHQKVTDLVFAHIVKLHKEGLSQRQIAERVGIDQASVCRWLRRAAEQGALGFEPVLPGFRISKVTTKTKDGYVTQSPDVEDVPIVIPEGHRLDATTLRRADGSYFKTRREAAGVLSKDDLLEAFGELRGSVPTLPGPSMPCDADLATLYRTTDLHIGMQAWGRETGVPWDLKIARSTVMSSISELVGCTPRADLAILLDLGDYTHNNAQDNVTPGHKHQLDVDGRFRKIAREAAVLRRDMIALLLQKHNRVIFRGLPGNHDPEVAQMLSVAFSLLFENNPRVTIDDDPSDFWFYEHGVVMLAGNHGHRLAPDKLPGVMAAYRPEMWGRTKVRQAFSGHIHKEKSGEENGARWETSRTAAPRDAYAHQHGYSSGRELTALTYHRTRGFRVKNIVEIL